MVGAEADGLWSGLAICSSCKFVANLCDCPTLLTSVVIVDSFLQHCKLSDKKI